MNNRIKFSELRRLLLDIGFSEVSTPDDGTFPSYARTATMNRRRLLLLGPLAGLLVLGVGAWFFVPHPAVTSDNAKKIANGMTLIEVESILGAPPGNYSGTNKKSWTEMTVKAVAGTKKQEFLHMWFGETASIGVWVDVEGLVVSKQYVEHAFQGERFLERMKRQLGL